MPGEPARQRIILHLDMDSFYASVEMQARPELRNKPVVIGADPRQGSGRGVVLTCSYEARAFGIRSAMPVSQAFVLCPHAIFLPPDFGRYAKVSSAVMAIVRSSGFPFQQVSIDEAFVDISELGSFRSAASLAGRIQNDIERELGITCSVGIAPSKLVAKIASDYKKPRGITVVEPAEMPDFLAPLPARKIPGVGKKAELALFNLGIRTIGDLAAYDTRKLVGSLGRGAAALHEMAQGIDESGVDVRSEARSISREITFESDTADPALISQTLDTLADEVFLGLTGEDLRCRTLTLKVRYQGYITRTRARTLSHYTQNKKTLLACAQSLLGELLEDDRKVRLLGLRLSSFERPDAGQMTLGL